MKIIKNVNVLFKANLPVIGSLLCVIFLFQANGAKAQTAAEGLRLVEVEQTGKALQVFNNLISSSPNDARLYYNRGYTYIQRDQPDSAMADFNKGISVNAKEAINYVGKGYVLLNQNKVQEAAASFDQAMSMTKNKNAEVLNAIAEAYLNAERKDLVKAKTLLERSKTLNKTNPETLLLLGDAYLLENNGGQAVTNYENATTINKNLTKAYLKIGRVFVRGRNVKASEENFNKVISLDPNYAPVYKDMGEFYYRTGRVEKAQQALAKYLELSDIKGASQERYAAFLFLSKDYPKAISVIKEVMQKKPDDVIMNRLLGYSSFEIGDYGTGVSAMQKYFTLAKPDKIVSTDYEYLGKNLINVNCDSLSLKDCDSLGVMNLHKAMEMDTTKSDMHQFIAEAYKKEKRFADAAKEYTILIEQKDKPAPQDYFNLGLMHYQAEKFVEADSAFTKVTELSPNFYAGFLYKAKAESQLDPDTEKGLAKSSYEKAIEMMEADAANMERYKKPLGEAYGYLGYYYVVKNDKAKSMENWKKVLTLDPGNKQAQTAIDALNGVVKPTAKTKGTKTKPKGASKTGTSKGTK